MVLLKQLIDIGHSYASAAAAMNRTYNSVRGYAKRNKIISHATGKLTPEINLPLVVANLPKYDQAMRLAGDFMIVSDVHAPATDWALASRVAQVARRWLKPPRRLLVIGDLMNFEIFSRYEALLPMPSLTVELEAARYAIQLWQQTFSEIYLTLGNHDYRWVKSLLGAYEEDTIIDLLYALLHNPSGLKVSIYPYLMVDTPTGLWHLSHIKNYSQVPLSVARKKANRHKDRHVLLAHQHHIGMALDESGCYMLSDLPMLGDPERLAYVGLGDSNAPMMKQGFGMLRNGTLTLFSNNPAWTDWGFWLD